MKRRAPHFFDGVARVHFKHRQHDWLGMTVDISHRSWRNDTPDGVSPRWMQLDHRHRLPMRVSATFCALPNLIAWLEAIACGVQACSFAWEGEGPAGRLFIDGDRFGAEWSASQGGGIVTATVDRRQLVAAVYQAYRGFVRSPRYQPLRYEALTLGEQLALANPQGLSEKEIVGHALMLDRATVETWLRGLRRIGLLVPARWVSDGTWPQGWPSLDSLEVEPHEEESIRIGPNYTPSHWDSMETKSRRTALEEVFSWTGYGATGSRLRELRSGIVERWLGWRCPRDPEGER